MVETSSQPRVYLAALLAGACMIGFAPILVRLSDLAPPSSAFWRMILAAGIASPLAWVQARRSTAEPMPISPRWLLLPGVLFAADLAIWHWSIALTTPANATLEANFAGVLVSLVGWLWLGERLRPSFFVGAVVAVGGAAVLLGVSFSVSPEQLLGDGLGFLTAVFYASYIISVKRLRDHYSALRIMSVAAVASAVFLLPIALLTPGTFMPDSIGQWGVVVALAAFVHCGGQGLIIFALARLPASFSAITLLVQPLVAAGAGWLLLGIAMSSLEVGGGVLVAVGIVLARFGSSGPRAGGGEVPVA